MPEKNKQIKILLLIAVFTIVVALFFAFDLQKYLTLEYLKSSKAFFISSYEKNPILVLGSYFLFYIVITAFSLPGAVWMTLGGGAFFGLFAGTVEAPGKLIKKNGKLYKNFRGMGSVGAMNKGSADRYFQKKQKDTSKYVPEGVEGLVKFKGNVDKIIYKLIGGLNHLWVI